MVQQWINSEEAQMYEDWVAIEAARWGADQELEALLDLADHLLPAETLRYLLETRRPKPQSLKEWALALLDKNKTRFAVAEEDVIRLALESLPD